MILSFLGRAKGRFGGESIPKRPFASLPDWIALILAAAALAASLWVSDRIYERLPHIEDEMAYGWQARVIAQGFRITTPTPVCPSCFLYPFVVDYNGLRFGKYPLAWPVVLAGGEKLGLRYLVNPLLAAFSVWLTYRLGRRLFNPATGLLGAFLTTLSPFFLMNSGSLLSSTWSLFLTLGFILAWFDAFTTPGSIPCGPTPTPSGRGLAATAAALCLGVLALTRPLTAVGVAIPFGVHAVALLIRGDHSTRLRLLGFGLLAAAVVSLYPAWQYAVTGNPFLNPYLLWWPYDKIGFGPGTGHIASGHDLALAWFQTIFSLDVGSHDLFGWPYLSYLFLPFGLYAGRRNLSVWLAAAVPLSLVVLYSLYWTPAWLYGPRYYFESISAAAVISAAGIRWLALTPSGRGLALTPSGRGLAPTPSGRGLALTPSGRGLGATRASPWSWLSRLRFGLATLLVTLLICGDLFFYLPQRLEMMKGLYQVAASDLAPFRTPEARAMPPTLVIVHIQSSWIEYGRLLDLSSPLFTSQFIFILSHNPELDDQVRRAFPDRLVWEYYPGLNLPFNQPVKPRN